MKKSYIQKFILIIFLLSLGLFTFFKKLPTKNQTQVPSTPTPTPSLVITPTATPSSAPLTFKEMNTLYGPCTKLPVLMFHHIEDTAIAKQGGYQNLTVNPESLKKDLQYLKDHNYQSIDPDALINFFDHNTPLPAKPVMLTFDDGYADFATNAAPLLSEFGFRASMYLPTGLIENPGYLKWNQIQSLKGSVYFGNHTWSHHSMKTNLQTIESEINTAEKQLQDHNLNSHKTFIYPYGIVSKESTSYLQKSGYKLAFTTVHGSIMCKKQRLLLPRLRIGNGSLSSYGL